MHFLCTDNQFFQTSSPLFELYFLLVSKTKAVFLVDINQVPNRPFIKVTLPFVNLFKVSSLSRLSNCPLSFIGFLGSILRVIVRAYFELEQLTLDHL